MTDAREIIAKALAPHGEDATLTEQMFSNAILEALHAAGFRVIGKDEVDPVTLEKAAKVAETGYWSSALGNAVGSAVAAAIRAIGRKA